MYRRFDPLNNYEAVGTPLARTTSYKYDANSNLWETTDPTGLVTQITFDALNRPTHVTEAVGTPMQRTTVTEFDKVSNVAKITDPLNHATRFEYDNLDRRTKTIDARNGETLFTYDPASNLLTLRDPALQVTTFAYDALNPVMTETDATGFARTFGVVVADNRTWAKDRNGRVRWFQYDAVDRQTHELWTDAAGNVTRTISFTYNPLDELTAASDPDSSYSYTYDNLSRVLAVSNAGTPGAPAVVLNHAYNSASERTSSYATINAVADFANSYVYDELGRLKQLTQNGTGVAQKRVDFTYNAVDQFQDITRFSDTAGATQVAKTQYTYDVLHRLETLTHRKPDNSIIAQYTLALDAADRITQIVSPDGTANYTHDDTDQLTVADHSVQTDENYSYDLNGNRTMTGYVTGVANRLLEDPTYTYQYDNEGNRTRRTKKSDNSYEVYEWDYRNRLTKVTEKTSTGVLIEEVSFTYDVFDRRIAKTVDSDGAGPTVATTERFVYDGDQVALAFGNTGSLTHRYLHGPAIDQVLADEQLGNDLFWTLVDHLGSVRDVINNSAAVVKHLAYDSFGKIVTDTNPTLKIVQAYTGREFEAILGLQYNRARWYDHAAGRWINTDPIKDGLNWYAYVENGPLTATDPWGLEGVPDRQSLLNRAKGLFGTASDRALEAYREKDLERMRRYNPARSELGRISEKLHERNDLNPDSLRRIQSQLEAWREWLESPDTSELPKYVRESQSTEEEAIHLLLLLPCDKEPSSELFPRKQELPAMRNLDKLQSDWIAKNRASLFFGPQGFTYPGPARDVPAGTFWDIVTLGRRMPGAPSAQARRSDGSRAGSTRERGLPQTAEAERALKKALESARRKTDLGPSYGTRLHSALKKEIDALGRPDVRAERSFRKGLPAEYGDRGSIRVDVIIGPPGSEAKILDLKTGSARLTEARKQEIRDHLPPALKNLPIEKIR